MGLLYDRGPGLPFNLALLILQDKIQLTRTKTKQDKTKHSYTSFSQFNIYHYFLRTEENQKPINI